MKPYSIDLRSQIVAAYQNNEGSMLKLACQYGVSRSFVQKIIKQAKTTGSVEPIGNGNRNSKLRNHTELITEFLKQYPKATLKELCQFVQMEANTKVCLSTMYRFVQKIERG